MSDEELAGMTPFQFNLKCEGFKTLKEREQDNFRMLAYITAAPNLKAGTNIQSIWPREGEDNHSRQPKVTEKYLDKVAREYLEWKALRILKAQQNIE